MAEKNRYWCGVLYTENMLQDWEDLIGDIVQLPYCYCIHDCDTDTQSEHRKEHVHLILVFNNTTTYKHAFSVFSELNAPGRIAVNTVKSIINIRSMYDYLIHDTETCRKLCKFLYDKSCRKMGNNFDIGNFEQVSLAEKKEVLRELCKIVYDEFFYNFADFYMYIDNKFKDDSVYIDVLNNHSGLIERIVKGNYFKWKEMQGRDY